MLHIALDDMEEKDLALLCEAKIPESLRLEFKESLDLASTKGKREVAKDVSAIANSDGGRVVYGIREESAAES